MLMEKMGKNNSHDILILFGTMFIALISLNDKTCGCRWPLFFSLQPVQFKRQKEFHR